MGVRGQVYRMKMLIWCLSLSAPVAAGLLALVLNRYDLAVITAVALLAGAQIVAQIIDRHPHEIDDARMTSLAQRISKTDADIENLIRKQRDQAQKLAELSGAVTPVATAGAGSQPAQFHPQTSMAGHFPGSNLQERPIGRPVAGTTTSVAPRTQLYLEPVVRISEGKTAYYKATLQAWRDGRGPGNVIVSSALPMPPGARSQWEPMLDLQLLQQTLPLLQKLHERQAGTGVFCPISNGTLEDENALRKCVALLQANPDAAAGIVLDMNHAGLSGLSEAGMHGLAWLASLGATMSLSANDIRGNDLKALSELGFAFIDVPVDRLSSPHPGDGSALQQAVQTHKIAVIASGLHTVEQAGQVSWIATLGCGPAYALPRPVRQQAEPRSAAANAA